MSSRWSIFAAAFWLGLRTAGSRGVASDFVHFEARQTHPLEHGRDETTLLALNSVEGRLSVLRSAGEARDLPVLVAEIPVGLGPVAVRARTADEAWVVNEVSDSLSVVSLRNRVVVATLPCPDEPADLLFAGGRAYVSCARSRQLRVFDAESRVETASIPLEGHSPRAMALQGDGESIAIAFLHSGNGTTVLPATLAPAPEVPWNPLLPPAPATARIVEASDPRVSYHVLDHDLSLQTTYQRALLDTRAGATNWTGFGLLHDGTGGLQALPTVHFYDLDGLTGSQFQDVAAYALCFETGTAPVVGRSITLTTTNRLSPASVAELSLLESQSRLAGVSEVVAQGSLGGTLVNLHFDPVASRYRADTAGSGWSREELLASLGSDDSLTALALPAGNGPRSSTDRDGNSVPDNDDSRPGLELQRVPLGWAVRFPARSAGWVIESAADLHGVWTPRVARETTSGTFLESLVESDAGHLFFRLRRTW